MTDWNLETTFTSPRLDLTIYDDDELNFEYRHKNGIEVRIGYSPDNGKKWKHSKRRKRWKMDRMV